MSTPTDNLTFERAETAIFDEMVTEYVAQHGEAPFTDIEVKDDSSIDIEFDDAFYDVASSKIENIQEIVQDYFVTILTAMVENPEAYGVVGDVDADEESKDG